MPAPAIEIHDTRSCRRPTPSASATTGMKKLLIDAIVAPIRPAAVAVITYAMPVPPAPSAISDAAGHGDQWPASTAGTPSGAVRITATPSARQITGNAPLRCCSGPDRL